MVVLNPSIPKWKSTVSFSTHAEIGTFQFNNVLGFCKSVVSLSHRVGSASVRVKSLNPGTPLLEQLLSENELPL